MTFKKPSDFGGGSYFKPKEHGNDLALLVEPRSINKDVPNTYQGRTTMRDEAVCDITVFGTSEALDKGTPTLVMSGVKVVHGMLSSTCERTIGEAFVARVDRIQTQNGSGYVWRDVDPEVESKVGAYYEARNTEPSFDD